MTIEVEQKFPIDDRAALERRLSALGAERGEAAVQVDCYFAHPGRDFAQTDEALRLRRVGELNYITYKGPKLDAVTKTRREIEISLAFGEAPALQTKSLLEALGFRPVTEVRKQRTHWSICWQDREIGVAIDEVAEVGSFVELEIMAESGEADAARAAIAQLAEHLELCKSERRSYLELLLAARGKAATKR
jgi:adenylate cyclase, class 2